MLRRSHKKSRKGCMECKRRHIKCDERRPICAHCLTAERECIFPGDADEPTYGLASTSPEGVSPGAGDAPSASSLSASGPATASAESVAPVSITTHQLQQTLQPAALDDQPHVDMVHMELLYHYMTNTNTSFYTPVSVLNREITMKYAVQVPYLMYQVLAISARHLSVIREDRRAFYHHLAIQLQTRALSLFNAMDLGGLDTIAKRIPVFIFSSVLGLHALCDALSFRDSDFNSALARYMGYLNLHRGIYKIIGGNWLEFEQSELRPIIIVGRDWYLKEGEGAECDDLLARLDELGWDRDTTQHCKRAVHHLQTAFDSKPDYNARMHLILSWPVMLQAPVVALLEAGRPEALVIMAYYFLMLYMCGKDAWLSGDAGRHLFLLTCDYLGPEWAAWLERPKQILFEFERSLQNESSSPSVPGGSSEAAQTDPGSLALASLVSSPLQPQLPMHPPPTPQSSSSGPGS